MDQQHGQQLLQLPNYLLRRFFLSLSPRFEINLLDETATLDVFVNDLFVTSYIYSDGNILMTERTSSNDVTLDILLENIESIKQWTRLIRKNIIPEVIPTKPYTSEIKKTDTKVEFSFSSEDQEITTAEFNPALNIITLKSRAELLIGYDDYLLWREKLNLFAIECEKF